MFARVISVNGWFFYGKMANLIMRTELISLGCAKNVHNLVNWYNSSNPSKEL